MQSVNGKIIVSVDLSQKNKIVLNGVEFSTAMNYEINYREKSPTIATVVEGNDYVREGDVLITHHNNFYLPSPYHLGGDLFSIPFGKTIFLKLTSSGDIMPICGNLICKKIEVETPIPLPPEQRAYHINKYEVIDGGWTTYKKGDIVLTRPHSGYDIIYFFGGVRHSVTKVDSDMVCGVIKKGLYAV